MSGPKVVNIKALRLQQRRETVQRMRELGSLLQSCQALAGLFPEEAHSMQERSDSLKARLTTLHDDENWESLLAEITSHQQFYLQEVEALHERAVDMRASALRRSHREGQAAKMQAAISEVEMLRRTENQQRSENVKLAAQAYVDRTPQGNESNRDPLPQPWNPEDDRLNKLWKMIAELSLAHEAEATQWQERLAAILSSAPVDRGLRLDSLVLELTSSLQLKRNQQAAAALISTVQSELQYFSQPEAEVYKAQLANEAATQAPLEHVKNLVADIRKWIEEETAREEAEAQRTAVLRGLAALGYEVREGMATAWSEQGRIVVHKPNEPNYGVEFAAPSAGNAMQTRVVLDGVSSSNRQRDVEMEDAWCGEFARLREILAEAGFQTAIAAAKASGAVPIKKVEQRDTRRQSLAENQSRTLPPPN